MTSDTKIMLSIFGTGAALASVMLMQIDGVNSRIDDLRSDVNNRIASMERTVNRAESAANNRTGGVQATMSDRVADLQEVVNTRIGDLQGVVNERVGDLGDRIDGLHSELGAFNTRLNSVEVRFAEADQRLRTFGPAIWGSSLQGSNLYIWDSETQSLVPTPPGNTTSEPGNEISEPGNAPPDPPLPQQARDR